MAIKISSVNHIKHSIEAIEHIEPNIKKLWAGVIKLVLKFKDHIQTLVLEGFKGLYWVH